MVIPSRQYICLDGRVMALYSILSVARKTSPFRARFYAQLIKPAFNALAIGSHGAFFQTQVDTDGGCACRWRNLHFNSHIEVPTSACVLAK